MKKAAITPDVGTGKTRVVDVSVDIAAGAYVPSGTTTAGSMFTVDVTDTGGASEAPQMCTTGPAVGTASSCSEVTVNDAAASITVTQTSAPAGLVVAPAQTQPTSAPTDCSEPFPGFEVCNYLNNDFSFTDDGVPPTANDDAYTVEPGRTSTLDVASNDDTAGAPVTSVDVQQPAHGSVTVNDTGTGNTSTGIRAQVAQPVNGSFTLSFTPAAGYAGADPFSYTLTTANGSSTAQVSVTVAAAAPTSSSSSAAAPSTASTSSQAVQPAADSDGLASTGVPTGLLLELGTGLVAAGGAVAVAGRRRRAGRHV